MAGRSAAGPPTGFYAGRLSNFAALTETEIEAFAAALGISASDLSQRGLGDGRSAIRALEMLVDADVERRIANAQAPTSRQVAVALAERAERMKQISEELVSMMTDATRGVGSASSAEAEVAVRLAVAGLPQPIGQLLRVAATAAAQALELDAKVGTDQWSPARIDDAAFGDLASLLVEIGFIADLSQDSEADHRPGLFHAIALALAAAVLDRLDAAGRVGVASAGMAASRLRKFIELQPVTIVRRLRQARERLLATDLSHPTT